MPKHWTVPEKNGGIFSSFPISEAVDRIEENCSRLDLSSLSVGSMDGNSFRVHCREELMRMGSGVNGGGQEPAKGRRIILSGHQPLLNHPGVWCKYFLLARIARETNSLAVNLEVDSDMAGPIIVPLPTRAETLRIAGEHLGVWTGEHALEALPPPSAWEWEDFTARARLHLASLPDKKILDRMETLARIGSEIIGKDLALSGFLTRLRRGFEEPAKLRYLSLPLSHVCGTRSFLRFFLMIAASARRFASVYNSAMEDYRKRHKLRYKANPFPDLRTDEGLCELPFWWIDERGARHGVLSSASSETDSEAGKFSLEFEGNGSCEVGRSAFGEAVERLIQSSIRVRPKALALTLFFRLFFCDLFLHGIGGGKYDEASDFIMREYFGVTPPHYLAASLTLYPEIGISGLPDGEEERLQARLREMKFKPEKFLDAIPDESRRGEFLEILRVKNSLLGDASVENKGKDFFRQIHGINETLHAFLEPARLETERQLAALRERDEEEKALRFREYPFFLFDPMRMAEIAKGFRN